MRTSEQINELAASLMVVQNTVGNLPKTAKGYGYDYTPLDEVTNALREPLAENSLSYTQMPTTPPEGYYPAVALTTRLMHVSGQWLEDTMVIPIPEVGKSNEAQAYGAALTYARRYALTAMFGIAADDDTDATYKPGPKASREKKAPDDSRRETSLLAQAKGERPKAQSGKSSDLTPPMPTGAMERQFHALGTTLHGDNWKEERAKMVEAITEQRDTGKVVSSSKELYRAEMQYLIDNMKEKLAD